MTEANVEIVRAALETWNRSWRGGDLGPALDVMDPDVVLDFSGNVFNPRVLRGHEGFRQLMADVAEVWDEVTFDVEELIPTDDGVLTLVVARARGRASGVAIEDRVAQVFTLRDGKITRVQAYADREEALATVGRIESPRRGSGPSMTGVDDWDEVALSALDELGAAGPAELAERVGVEQFDEGMARSWLVDALGRGLVRHGEGSLFAISEQGPPASDPRDPVDDPAETG